MKKGLTLIELMLVILMIALVAGLLAPSVGASREAAQRTVCRNNLHQVSIAMQNYQEMHRLFPPAYTCRGMEGPTTAEVAWGVLLLPYIEEMPLYGAYDFNVPAHEGNNARLSRSYLQQYECPSQTTGKTSLDLTGVKLALTSYQPCWGENFAPDGAFGGGHMDRGICTRNSRISFRHIRDGASQTFLVGEVLSADVGGVPGIYNKPIVNFWAGAARQAKHPVVWVGSGTRLPLNQVLPKFESEVFGSRHAQGANFAMADGQIRFIREDIDFRVYQALSTIFGMEVFGDDEF